MRRFCCNSTPTTFGSALSIAHVRYVTYTTSGHGFGSTGLSNAAQAKSRNRLPSYLTCRCVSHACSTGARENQRRSRAVPVNGRADVVHPCCSCHQPVLFSFPSNRGVTISHGEPLQHSPDAAAPVEARLRRGAPPMLKVGSVRKGPPRSQRRLNANGGAIDISTCAPRCHQEGSNSSSFSVSLCPRQSISTTWFDLGLPGMSIETQAVEADMPQCLPLISNMELGRGSGWEMKNPRAKMKSGEGCSSAGMPPLGTHSRTTYSYIRRPAQGQREPGFPFVQVYFFSSITEEHSRPGMMQEAVPKQACLARRRWRN
ncbi:hypothetical protein LY76DRAFT_84942 [Colletotrichum caudatum]|nr:hypothetical protein LY76DRAFT_84942 [Colletotrichum caudatum]